MAGGSIAESETSSFRITWRIDGFSQMTAKKIYSDVFEVGGYKWRVLIFPKGNNVDCLSIYLDAADSFSLPEGWTTDAQFSLTVVSQIHTMFSWRKESQHRFNKHQRDWGFTSFMPLKELFHPSRGYLVNDTLVVEVLVICNAYENDTAEQLRNLSDGFVHERLKKEQEDLCTIIEKPPQNLSDGFVQERLKKEQEDLHPIIEKSPQNLSDGFVQERLKKEQEDICTNIEKSPQNVSDGFVKERLKKQLEDLRNIIEKSPLKLSNGFVQERLKKEQEDLCTIFEKSPQNLPDGFVQERLKKEQENLCTVIEKSAQNLSDGFVHEGLKKEQEDLCTIIEKSSQNLPDGFVQERLKKEQENLCTVTEKSAQNFCDGFVQERLKKEQEDLCTIIEKSTQNLPDGFVQERLKKEQEDVCTVIEKSAQNLSDGFVQERLKKEQEDLCTIIEKSAQNLSDGSVQERLKKGQEDLCTIIEKSAQNLSDGFVKERLKKELEALYTIKVVQDEDLAEHIGNDIYFDYDEVKSFRVPKDTSFNIFKEEVAKELGIPAQFQRFWIWIQRKDHSFRPFRPLTQIEEAGTVGQLREVIYVEEAELELFLEVERGLDLHPIAPLKKRDNDILLFFNLYDSEEEEIRYVGRLFVNPSDKLSEILTRLNKLAGYDPDEEIDFYEKIDLETNAMWLPLDKNLTFLESKLDNGDILCFQKASVMDNGKHIRNPDVPSYLKYMQKLQLSFSLWAKESKYEEPLEKQNKNIIAEEMNTMIDENVIAAIDRVLSEGITISIQSQHSVLGQEISLSLPEQLLQELSDIVFKEDLVEKFKKGLTPETDFNLVMEKIDAYDDLFSSRQLEQVGAVKNLLNNLVRRFEIMEYLKKKQDSAKKRTDKHNEALKKTREKILTSQTSFTDHQTQLNSLDGEIADLKAKLEKLQGDRENIAEIQDQEKDKITSLNKEVKSIFHRLVDDHIKVKAVEDKIPEAQADLENYEKLYQFMKAAPPF